VHSRSCPIPATRWLSVCALALSVAVVGCSGDKKKPASQVAAKVNKEELSVHQINHVLQGQTNIGPQQVEAAGRQVLERLIDQELAIQKAADLKIDRQPQVVQAIEAARREIIARAYVERIGDSVPRPSPEQVRKYYADKPALFAERRIYTFQAFTIEATPGQVEDLRGRVKAAKSAGEFVDHLKAAHFKFEATSLVRTAEQLPLALLAEFANLKDGQPMLLPAATGAQVLFLARSQSDPLDLANATPLIEQFLLNASKRKLVEEHTKALRALAKIEYVGTYAAAASAVAGSQETPAAAAPAASGLDDVAIRNALSGFK